MDATQVGFIAFGTFLLGIIVGLKVAFAIRSRP